MPSSQPQSPAIRCRQIDEADLKSVADLLTAGFPERTRAYWINGLEKLKNRPTPPDCPRFGYLLEAGGRPVGVLLLIFTALGEGAHIRCNVSSWYVDPAFRSYGALLTSAAMKFKHVTYLNTSPAEHTLPILQARDYVRYSDGQFVSLPVLSKPGRSWPVRSAEAVGALAGLSPAERELMRGHIANGCVALVCDAPEGPQPFVFIPRRLAYAPLPLMQLVFCRDTAEFVRCAGPLGRHLLGRGVGGVLCDANAPIPGLVGKYFKGKAPRYFKGPDQPRLNDLAFTEAVLFGA
jgi:hypothetical protein